MTKQELIQQLAEETNLQQKQVSSLLTALTGICESEIRETGALKIPGLVTFKKVYREGRNFRNPQTGESFWKDGHHTVRANPWKNIKEAVS